MGEEDVPPASGDPEDPPEDDGEHLRFGGDDPSSSEENDPPSREENDAPSSDVDDSRSSEESDSPRTGGDEPRSGGEGEPPHPGADGSSPTDAGEFTAPNWFGAADDAGSGAPASEVVDLPTRDWFDGMERVPLDPPDDAASRERMAVEHARNEVSSAFESGSEPEDPFEWGSDDGDGGNPVADGSSRERSDGAGPRDRDGSGDRGGGDGGGSSVDAEATIDALARRSGRRSAPSDEPGAAASPSGGSSPGGSDGSTARTERRTAGDGSGRKQREGDPDDPDGSSAGLLAALKSLAGIE